MRVLISGGEKTINIIETMQKRFSAGSVEFTMMVRLEEIEEFISKGDLFDKAILIDQAWGNKDGNRLQARSELTNFIEKAVGKYKYGEMIFIATDEDMARIVLEETFDIRDKSRVVLKEPPYSAGLFSTLITSDLDKLPESLLYTEEQAEELEDKIYNESAANIQWSIGNEEDNNSEIDMVSKPRELDLSIDIEEEKIQDEPESGISIGNFDSEFEDDGFEVVGEDKQTDIKEETSIDNKQTQNVKTVRIRQSDNRQDSKQKEADKHDKKKKRAGLFGFIRKNKGEDTEENEGEENPSIQEETIGAVKGEDNIENMQDIKESEAGDIEEGFMEGGTEGDLSSNLFDDTNIFDTDGEFNPDDFGDNILDDIDNIDSNFEQPVFNTTSFEEAESFEETGFEEASFEETSFEEAGFEETEGFEEAGFEEAEGFEETGFEETGFEETGFEETGFEEASFEETSFEEAEGFEDLEADIKELEDEADELGQAILELEEHNKGSVDEIGYAEDNFNENIFEKGSFGGIDEEDTYVNADNTPEQAEFIGGEDDSNILEAFTSDNNTYIDNQQYTEQDNIASEINKKHNSKQRSSIFGKPSKSKSQVHSNTTDIPTNEGSNNKNGSRKEKKRFTLFGGRKKEKDSNKGKNVSNKNEVQTNKNNNNTIEKNNNGIGIKSGYAVGNGEIRENFGSNPGYDSNSNQGDNSSYYGDSSSIQQDSYNEQIDTYNSNEQLEDSGFDSDLSQAFGYGTYDNSLSGDDLDDLDEEEKEKIKKQNELAGIIGEDQYSVTGGSKESVNAGTTFRGQQGAATKKKKNRGLFNNKRVINDDELRVVMNTFLSRGCTLSVTGAPNVGKTTVAYNLANMVAKLGYTVLLVDMDTVTRGMAYMNKDIYEVVHQVDTELASVKAAINNCNAGIDRNTNIVRPGFHVVTCGLAADLDKASNMVDTNKLSRFMNTARTTYNFVILDIPFNEATTTLKDMVFASDYVIDVVEANNHGLMTFLLNMANIEDEEVQDFMFNKSKICFNKVYKLETVFGSKISTIGDILVRLDNELEELIGDSAEYLFREMKTCGILNLSPTYEQHWFTDVQVSDTVDGEKMFIDMWKDILIAV